MPNVVGQRLTGTRTSEACPELPPQPEAAKAEMQASTAPRTARRDRSTGIFIHVRLTQATEPCRRGLLDGAEAFEMRHPIADLRLNRLKT